MSVYVDNVRIRYRHMIMCHMLADTVEELHEMADKIGIKRKWFQNHSTPHYDICASKRALAVAKGARIANRQTVVAIIRRFRQQEKNSPPV